VALPVPLNAAQPKISTPVAGAPLRFFGFVAPFGSAPPAFNATTLVSYASTAAQADLDWNVPGVTAPFTQIDAAKLEVSMATLQTAAEAELKLGPQSVDLSMSVKGITFVPDSLATYTSFAIAHQMSGSVSTYASFDALVVALKAGLNGTTALYRLHAAGPYDPGTSTLSASRLYVVLND
jgi:autotransporter translocation and assembly factor TamB